VDEFLLPYELRGTMTKPRYRLLAYAAACGVAVAICGPLVSLAQDVRGKNVDVQSRGSTDEGLELVDPNVLRACADPNNLPFSNAKGEGFENALAELLAAKLNKTLAYTYYPQATGFVRMTLNSHRCDVIMGYPQGADLVQNTNPYYQTAYAIVAKAGSPLDRVETLGDPRLKDRRLGIVAGTPPANYFVTYGLMSKAKPYPLVIDTRVDSSAAAMMRDIASGEIDAGVLWGPMAGYYASRSDPSMHVALLLKESGGPRLIYRITMGVRPSDQNWKRELNRLIAENQSAINKVLLDFGVPLLDGNERIITSDSLPQKP
jgi:quinoprotein dehydrogenase-associated probable ABC transporter substrate-binding protein